MFAKGVVKYFYILSTDSFESISYFEINFEIKTSLNIAVGIVVQH